MAKSGQYLWEPLKMKGKDDINSYTSNYQDYANAMNKDAFSQSHTESKSSISNKILLPERYVP